MFSYHIKDDYFVRAAQYLGTTQTNLMSNKENGGYRPHFLCFPDRQHSNIFWAVPQSSRCQKFRALMNTKIRKYGRCDTIVIGRFGGRDNAFLIQNMFPVSRYDLDHIHTIGGNPVVIHPSLEAEIIRKAKRTLARHKQDKRIIFPNIDALYQMVLNSLQSSN